MDFKIEKYLLKKAEELAFITIKHGGEFKLKSYEVPKGGLDVPIKNEVLVKGIKEKTAQDNLNALSKDIDLDLKSYMGYMSRKYFEIGEHTDSLIYIKAFITMYPDDLDAMYNYAIVCQEIAKQYQKDMDDKAMNAFLLEAMAKLEKVIDVDENFALGYYHLGYHYYNQGQYLKTKLTWEEALRLGLDADLVAEVQENLGKMDFKVQYEEGYTLVFQGKFKEGLEKLLPLEEEHMDWWNLLFMIALGYKGMDEIEQAKMYLEKILIIKPNQVDTIVELGLCEAYKNNLDKAIEYFEQAAKIKEDPEILCNLGMAYLNNGDIDDATYYIERAYELNPQDEITIACLRELGINK